MPPLFRYLSQCSGRLNPNLYDNGKVCVSLLGTWIGKVRPKLKMQLMENINLVDVPGFVFRSRVFVVQFHWFLLID